MVGDPEIEPGVRLREGVIVRCKFIQFNRLYLFGPKEKAVSKYQIGTRLIRYQRLLMGVS